jgi:hypothetical protein
MRMGNSAFLCSRSSFRKARSISRVTGELWSECLEQITTSLS